MDLVIRVNGALPSLKGLERLASVGEDLVVVGNESLTTLNGLENLTDIGGGLGSSRIRT